MEQDIDWKKEVCRRAAEEYEAFVEGLKKLPFEEVLEHAQEAVVKRDIVKMLGNGFGDMELEGFQKEENVLSAIYHEWQETNSNYLGNLRQAIQQCSSKILTARTKEYYKNPEAALYRKDITEAKTAAEAHLWNGDFVRSKECLDYFNENSEDAYNRMEALPFLQSWVKEFGLERCKTLLALAITKTTAHDKRYSREVVTDAASIEMPNKGYWRIGSRVHAVVINGAYRKLMEMERGRDSPKGKDDGKPRKTESRKRTEPER